MSIISELFDDIKFVGKYRIEVGKRQKKLNNLAPKVGDLATDFTLSDISGSESITLSDFRGKKPVALVFGSFT